MITRISIALLAVAAVVGCDETKSSSADSPGRVVAGGKPKIEIVGGNVVDWGNVAPGKLEKVVQITNTGNDTLKITQVKPSCGCTTAPLDKEVLLPGDTASMKVSVDVASSSGAISKHMTVYSNDSTNQAMEVTLKANLVRDITMVPEVWVTQGAKVGQETTTSVVLKNTSNTPLSVGPPTINEASDMIVRFDMSSPVVIAPGDSTTLTAHVKPVKGGASTVDIVLPTNSKSMPSMLAKLTVAAQ